MTLVQGIVVFSMLWWTLIFCVLPFFYRPSDEEGVERPKPKLGKIVLFTTLLSISVWLIIYGLIEANVLDFYKLGQEIAVKDGLQ